MSAHVSNLTMAGSAGRVTRGGGLSGVVHNQVDALDGASAAPARDQTERFEYYEREGRAVIPRRYGYGAVMDGVVGFGSVLVSQEVGAAIMKAQALYGSALPPPVEAERQIANYEFAQSLMGPPEVMQQTQQPFPQQIQ